MSETTKDFWLGASAFVALGLSIAVIWMALVWGNRYFQWDHAHSHVHPAHEHPHKHAAHQHPHEWPKHGHPHKHPHKHTVSEGE